MWFPATSAARNAAARTRGQHNIALLHRQPLRSRVTRTVDAKLREGRGNCEGLRERRGTRVSNDVVYARIHAMNAAAACAEQGRRHCHSRMDVHAYCEYQDA
jgi:hypothetical protein